MTCKARPADKIYKAIDRCTTWINKLYIKNTLSFYLTDGAWKARPPTLLSGRLDVLFRPVPGRAG